MARFAYSEKQTLSQSQRLAGRRFIKYVLRIIAYVRQGKGREKDWQRKKKKELRWTLSEHWMTLQRCPELGHEGQAFISTRWPVTGCGAPWDKMVTLRRETSAEATAEGGWQLRAVLFYPHHCWYLGEWGLQSWSCLGSVFHTAHHREEI